MGRQESPQLIERKTQVDTDAKETSRASKYWDDDYIKYEFFLPRPSVKKSSHEPKHAQCMSCYFKYSNQFLGHSNLQSHLQENTAFIRTNPHNFSSNSTNICANSKIPSIHQSQMTLLVKTLFVPL